MMPRGSKVDIEKVKSMKLMGMTQLQMAEVFDVEQQTIAAAIKKYLAQGGSMEKTELNEEEYAIAKSNGISRDLARQRFEYMFWDLKKAITQPPSQANRRRTTIWERWKFIAKANGIDRTLFIERIRKGMDEKDAATKPKLNRIDKKIIETARKNGIQFKTLQSRIIRGMPPEEACIKPVRKRRTK